jgi:hypothetical protein
MDRSAKEGSRIMLSEKKIKPFRVRSIHSKHVLLF